MAAKSKHKWLPSRKILLLLGFMVKLLQADLVSRCSEQCAVILADDSVIDRDISCNQTCTIDACSTGCGLWDNTTLATCNLACNSTFLTQQNKVQYCQSGCVYAEDVYAEEIRRVVGDPTSPRISDEEIESRSVILEWDEAGHNDVVYLVQWRYKGSTIWITYQLEPTKDTYFLVLGLHPYKTYEFRIQWVITSREILSSPPSRSVTTLAEGVPESPPTITSLLSPSASTITVAWQPPEFPNGPLVSYTVSIEGPDDFPMRNEVSETVLSYTWVRLSESTKYDIEIEANNMDGASPTAKRSIITVAGPNVTSTLPYLVVGLTAANFDAEGQESMVSFVDINRLNDFSVIPADVHIVGHDNYTIQDVGVHYWKSLAIFSDTKGTLHKRHIDVNNFQSGSNTSSEIIYQSMGGIIPTVVDVDWLFDHIYFVEEDQILRCKDLNCSEIEVAVNDLDSSPTDVKVDPYHGYLYWSEIGDGKGIYRIDLGDIGTGSGFPIDLVIQADTIRSFVVDSYAFEIFYANEGSLSLDGAFLDGTEQKTILPSKGESTDDDFVDVNGIVYYNNLFTWTRYTDMIDECFIGNYEYTEDKMYTNVDGVDFRESTLFACPEAFHGLDVFHPSYQPYPVPAMPPTDLQALFVDTAAELSWLEPQRLDSIGRGVWQDWQYMVELINIETREETIVDGNTTLAIRVPADDDTAATIKMRVSGLMPSTQYRVKVRAFSLGGEGPSSEPFNGTTLQTVNVTAYVVFSGDSDIVRVGMDGNNQNVLHNQATVKDLDWYGDSIFWVDSNGLIFQASIYDQTSSNQLPIPQNAESLAIDWLGGVLYWGDLKKHKIFRIGLNSEGPSTAEVAYLSDAQDIALDAVSAYMYWSTAQSVECARLNGKQYFEYRRNTDFSGVRVAGLTLDLDGGYVYWFELSFVEGAQQLTLYRAGMAGYNNNQAVEEISVINSITEKPALHYYSQKLMWIDQNNKVFVGDMRGENLATLSGDPAHAMTVIQESTLHPLPADHDAPPNVIPSTIPESSVDISGTYDDFTITWDASTEVTYGEVLYEISYVSNNALPVSLVLEEPMYRIQGLEPYSELQISLVSYTYWAYAEAIMVMKNSPQSVPTIPLNPRVFILEDKNILFGNSSFIADIRWETVEKANGLLLGYKIQWRTSEDSLFQELEASPDAIQYTLEGLAAGTTYLFKIIGYTEIGNGPETNVIEVSTAAPNPPPTLITISPGGNPSQRDTDTKDAQQLLGGASVDAVAMVFDAESESLYWLDSDGKLKTSPMFEDDIVELADIQLVSNPSPNSFTLNWITRQLYWPEPDGIYMFDTAQQTAQKVMVVGIDEMSKVVGVGVNPLKSTLLWTEQSQEGDTTIMTSNLSGENIRPLFASPAKRRRRQTCTCSDVNPGPVMVVDLSDASNGMVYFVAGDESGDIWASDLEGCQCRKVVDATSLTDSGLPADSLSVDNQRLYWTNTDQDIVASVDKTTGSDFQSESAGGATFVIAFGNNLQPFPDSACLVPLPYDQTAQLTDIASDGLTLTLDPATSSPECTDISLATPMYTVHYSLAESPDAVMEETTSSTSVILSGLEPYTNYSIEVSVANLYTSGEQPRGPGVVYRTKEGVPSVARNLAITVLTQSIVNATWTLPVQPNGDPNDLRYRIEYGESDEDGKSTTSFADVIELDRGKFSITIEDLGDDDEYEFWVRSYPVDGTEYSITSDPVLATTFATPAPVQLVGSTDETLVVAWQAPSDGSIIRHAIQYAEDGWVDNIKPDPGSRLDWTETSEENTINSTLYEVTLEFLRPYTYYHVRTHVTYQSGLAYVYETGDAIIVTLETSAGPPGQPLPPRVEEDSTNTYVTWTPPAANGPGDLSFVLQAAKKGVQNWDVIYKGMDTLWRFNQSVLTYKETYRFRVSAIREGDQGPFSTASNGHLVVAPPTDGGLDPSILYAIIAAVVVLLIVIMLACIVVRRSKAANKRKAETNLQVHFSPDQELATLRNMPTSVVNRDNTLYAVTTTNNGTEVELPLFPRERLKLVTFLGSGAFGEVFEGLATDIQGSGTGDCRVAVKTLRKGATDEEKDDFLKEAALMGNFQNEHIIRLLGVCLDNDPQFIILELMEGGDLLTYIRGARASSATPARLSSSDLTDIITDVAKGCQYLESIKFVHRDLAARNCLVNTKDYAGPNVDRSVKIGDFGLARDIYKSDYYRKEGEGLLPVRWMSPEALVDGIFSVQSDVWSYGVLMWEVMTLGQQPYPARNNLDVLNFVTAGGRLSRPDNCPDDIHHIMIQCWNQEAGSRPSFQSVVANLESYKRNSLVGGGVDNQGFENSAAMSVKYARLQDPALDEYLLPMDSAQSLSDPTVPGAGPRQPPPPSISINNPNYDIDRQKSANAEQVSQGARSKRPSFNAPSRKALDDAVANLPSREPSREQHLEPRYHAFPPKGSMGKAAGRKLAPAIPDHGPPLDPPGRPGSQHGPMIDPEDVSVNNNNGAAAASARNEDPPPELHPRRHPNPFRKNSFDESEPRQYVNLPEDSHVSVSANV